MLKPELIDTHAHVNFNSFKNDGHEVIKRALDKNIWVINVGSQYTSSKRALKYASEYKKGVYAVVGLHPSHVYNKTKRQEEWGQVEGREFEDFDEKKYQKLLGDPKAVAMGEIGLDYYEGISEEEKDKQKQVLFAQLELAQRMNKPVVLHCRKAYPDLISIISMFNTGCASCPMACSSGAGLRGVVHCFVGRWSQAQQLLSMGFYFSFNGIITYARDYDKVIKNLPLDKIVLETDCPWLTPEPHRKGRNEPSYVKYVAEKLAEIKKISYKEVAKQTTKNARELFGV